MGEMILPFTDDAADAFVATTVLAIEHGLLDFEEFRCRLSLLFGTDLDAERSPVSEGENRPADNGYEGAALPNGLVHFGISSPASLAQWVFTIGDPDPLPSIPHGHYRHQNGMPKLDPYTGWISDRRGARLRRLTRAEVAGFWNDVRFRANALAAIQHALTDPAMSGAVRHMMARTSVPERLPRRRH